MRLAIAILRQAERALARLTGWLTGERVAALAGEPVTPAGFRFGKEVRAAALRRIRRLRDGSAPLAVSFGIARARRGHRRPRGMDALLLTAANARDEAEASTALRGIAATEKSGCLGSEFRHYMPGSVEALIGLAACHRRCVLPSLLAQPHGIGRGVFRRLAQV